MPVIEVLMYMDLFEHTHFIYEGNLL